MQKVPLEQARVLQSRFLATGRKSALENLRREHAAKELNFQVAPVLHKEKQSI